MAGVSDKFYLGIDQGTTQTTAVVVDQNGVMVAASSVKVPVYFPASGRVEQAPSEILQSVLQAVRPLLAEFDIAAVGFDNQGETFVLWDREGGEALTPAVVWQDKRGDAICASLAKQIDGEWLRQKTGLVLDSYFSAPKLRFMLDEDPRLGDLAQKGRLLFGTTESWVLWHLSDRQLHVTDPSTASRTLLFNIHDLAWDPDLLELFGVSEQMLPRVAPSAGYAGDLRFEANRSLPLTGLLVDQQAALFGQACYSAGEMKCSFGTGSFLLANVGEAPVFSEHGLLTTVAWHIDGKTTYALDGGIFVTGAAVQWLAESLGIIPDPAASAALAEESRDRDVVCVPALAGLAAPHWKTNVRGAFFGLSRATRPADLVRATLEGIALRVQEVVQVMALDTPQEPAALKVDGGPTANGYLMQFLADILGLEVQVAAAREATAIGAANLAALAVGDASLEELGARWRAEAVYAPQMGQPERQAHLSRWQRAVQSVSNYHQVTA